MFQVEQHLNCIQQNLVEVCKYFNVEFYYIFFDSWKFNYNKSNVFAKSLLMPDKSEGSLCELTDIKARHYDYLNDDLSKAIDLVQDQGKKSKIMIMLDSYFCPWHRGYKVLHIPHWCLVKQYLAHEKFFTCEDPFYKVKDCQISFSELQKGLNSLILYTMEKGTTKNRKEIDIFKDYIKKLDIEVMTSDMYDFANRILEIENVEEFFDYKQDVYLCSIFRALKFTADMRYNLSYLFDKFCELQKDIFYKKVADVFEKCGEKFDNINCGIIKLFYSCNNFKEVKEGIHKSLLEIILHEKQAYEILYDYWFE